MAATGDPAHFRYDGRDRRRHLVPRLQPGFYNLFLAIGTALGIAVVDSTPDAGIALVAMGTGSMLAAALVLVTADTSRSRPAAVQGVLPLLALVSLVVWWVGS